HGDKIGSGFRDSEGVNVRGYVSGKDDVARRRDEPAVWCDGKAGRWPAVVIKQVARGSIEPIKRGAVGGRERAAHERARGGGRGRRRIQQAERVAARVRAAGVDGDEKVARRKVEQRVAIVAV